MIAAFLSQIFGSADIGLDRTACSIEEMASSRPCEKANGHDRFADVFKQKRTVQAARRRQLDGALVRLDRVIREFGTELVETAKANGNGVDRDR